MPDLFRARRIDSAYSMNDAVQSSPKNIFSCHIRATCMFFSVERKGWRNKKKNMTLLRREFPSVSLMICNNKMILLTHIMQHMSRIRTTPPLCAKRRRCGRCGGFFVGSAREEAFSEGAVHARRRTCEGSGTERKGVDEASCSRSSPRSRYGRARNIPISRHSGRGRRQFCRSMRFFQAAERMPSRMVQGLGGHPGT